MRRLLLPPLLVWALSCCDANGAAAAISKHHKTILAQKEAWDTVQKARLEHILDKNIAPWWVHHTVDHTYGGFRLHHTDNNTYLGPNEKLIVTQARMVWFYALLCSDPERTKPEYQEMAKHGLRFILDKMWDNDNKAFYYQVTHNGTYGSYRPANEMFVYGQAFALYALSQYYLTFKDSEALDRANQVFDMLMTVHDDRHRGFHESVCPNWTINATGPGHKSINTQMHVLEAVTTYARATKNPTAAVVLQGLVEVLTTTAVESSTGMVPEAFNEDWSWGVNGNDVWFGHINELIWLKIETCDALEITPSAALKSTLLKMWNFTMAHGFDQQKGAFNYNTMAALAEPVQDWKDWWTECESMLAALYLRRVLNDRSFEGPFERLLDWIEFRQVNWEYGEFHRQIVNDTVDPNGLKAEPWKGPYHNGRAMLFGIKSSVGRADEAVDEVPESPAS